MTWRALDPSAQPIRRFVLLLPNADVHEVAVARALWTLAGERGATVQVIALIDDWADEGLVRTRTVLLAALLRESGLNACITYEQNDADWLRIARKAQRAGDVFVCMAEQSYPVQRDRAGLALAPLSRHLAMLHVPVCELSGVLLAPPANTFKRTFKTLLLPALIIAGSLALEMIFVGATRAWAAWIRHATIGVYTLIELFSITRIARG
jgi:hypothetical protein